MQPIHLGKLDRVPLRTIWASEPYHFSQWLAQAENLNILGTTLGLGELELEGTEEFVGQYRADIVCRISGTDDTVLIENQLEKSDHDHLGKLIVYAAGLKAKTVIWIAERIQDEHRAAIDWLNDHASQGANFFAIEMELWRIGDSAPAPKFNIVCQPNEWTSRVEQIRAVAVSGETQEKRVQFWTGLSEYLRENKSPVRSQKITTSATVAYAVGRSGFTLRTLLGMRDGYIGVQFSLSGPDAEYNFTKLLQQKDQIESEIGAALLWRKIEKSCVIELFQRDVRADDPEYWPQAYVWVHRVLSRFYEVFVPRIKYLSAAPEATFTASSEALDFQADDEAPLPSGL